MAHIYDMLEEDHQEAKDLIGKIEESEDGAAQARAQAFAKLKHALDVHMQFEESVVYPALRKIPQFKDDIADAVEEHQGAKEILKAMEALEPTDAAWMSKLEELKQDLEHHISDEEDELFPESREPLGEERGEAMGEQYGAVKREDKQAA